MKITISGPVTAIDGNGRRLGQLAELKEFHGLTYVKERLADHITRPLDEVLDGGMLRLYFDVDLDILRIEAMYRATRKLGPVEMKSLVDQTRAMWAGDLGERAFAEQEQRTGIHLDLTPRGLRGGKAADIHTVQLDDGVMPKVQLPLATVAGRGYLDQVRQRVEKHENINARDKFNDTPLSAAIRFKQSDTAVFLIQHGADVGPAGADGRTAIHDAAIMGLVEVVRALLKRGMDANTLCTNPAEMGMTPIMFAAIAGRLPVVQLLHAGGATLDCQTPETPTTASQTLLMWADALHLEVIQWLLDHGADPRLCNARGMTASEVARYQAGRAAKADRPDPEVIRALETKAELLAKYEAVPLE